MATDNQNSSSTWPRDVISGSIQIPRNDLGHLIVFLACPFNPKEKYDDLFNFIQGICNIIGLEFGATVECIRSDKISTPGIIHTDIWSYLAQADALVFDVTGENGNVLLELGVASSCRSPHSIIIIKDDDDIAANKYLFDIQPARHALYSKNSFTGVSIFQSQLRKALHFALAPSPYEPKKSPKSLTSFEFDSNNGFIPDELLSPPECHRALKDDGLEFGSLWLFKSSWLTIGESYYRDVEIDTTMRFSTLRPNTEPSKTWIGIALRSLHFFVDYGYLVYVLGNGDVYYIIHDNEKKKDDIKIDTIANFTLQTDLRFKVSFKNDELNISVNDVKKVVDLKGKYVPNAGKIRFQTYNCRGLIRSINAKMIG